MSEVKGSGNELSGLENERGLVEIVLVVLLLLVLLKEKQLVQFARARPDLWEQCVEDVLESGKWELCRKDEV